MAARGTLRIIFVCFASMPDTFLYAKYGVAGSTENTSCLAQFPFLPINFLIPAVQDCLAAHVHPPVARTGNVMIMLDSSQKAILPPRVLHAETQLDHSVKTHWFGKPVFPLLPGAPAHFRRAITK